MTLQELSPGMHVSWICVKPGGYGFPIPVDAIVVKVTKSRVRIEVPLHDGTRVERVVKPDALRRRYT